jgi:hypothetical protein
MPETDALDHTDAVAIPITKVDIGVATAVMPPTVIRTAIVPVAIPTIVIAISVAIVNLNR